MNIIVLGATSQIGSSIASAFAPGNNLILVGRNTSRLRHAAERCYQGGASRITELAIDLRKGCGDILSEVGDSPVDLIINASSATSRLRDDEIPPDKLADHVTVDLLAPFELVKNIVASRNPHPVKVIFVSTVLTLVKSPNRSIYSELKILHERCLKSLVASHNGYLLIVKVGKVIPPDEPTAETGKLAKAVTRSFERRKRTLFYGMAGRVAVALFYLQPAIFYLAVKARRILSSVPQAEGSEEHSLS